MFKVDNIVRKHLKKLKAYSSARSEFSGTAKILLDANESPFDTALNRYPDPNQTALKEMIADIEGLNVDQIFLGNGSDEAIDLLIRAFCEPGEDKVYVFQPTYAMYGISAEINQVELVNLNLTDDFQLPKRDIIKQKLDGKGIVFLCSPNNPTGNTFELEQIEMLANSFKGLVVVDEAYIDFSNALSAISLLDEIPNVVVLQTMSKSYGLAGARLGMAYASAEIINILNKIKPPYNINTLTQSKAMEVLKDIEVVRHQIRQIQMHRDLLSEALEGISAVKKVYPSEANFLLVEFKNADKVYELLRYQGIILRNRTNEIKNCLRITVGTAEQNTILIDALKKIEL